MIVRSKAATVWPPGRLGVCAERATVSTSVFVGVQLVLSKQHGDRLVTQADLNKLIALGAGLEHFWCCLPKANATLEMKGEPSE